MLGDPKVQWYENNGSEIDILYDILHKNAHISFSTKQKE